MRRSRLIAALAFAGLLAGAAPARAQIDDTSWGLTAGFAPLWKVPESLATTLDAATLDIRGQELRVGVVRGTTLGGEWGITLVHKRLSKDSVVAVRQTNDVISVVTDDAEMLGVELHRFFPFFRAGRVQVGVNLGGGVAQMRGFVTGSVEAAGGVAIRAPIGFSELFELAGQKISVFPLARAEVAAAAMIGDRVKVRVGSGFNMPGVQLVSVTVSTLLGRD